MLYEYKERYLFNWDDVPGDDNIPVQKYLQNRCGIKWVKDAEVQKSRDNQTITIRNKENFLIFTLNEQEGRVDLEIDDGRTYSYILRRENGKLRIYQHHKEPILEIDVINPENGRRVERVKFVVDTGASLCRIPRYVIAHLRAIPFLPVLISDWKGDISEQLCYRVKLCLENYESGILGGVATDEKVGLIGDSLLELNKYILLLDRRNRKCGVFNNCKYIQRTPKVIAVELSD